MSRPTPKRSLMPREHGAYGQLVLPAAAALIAWPSFGGAALAVAATAMFLAHEPALVLLGQRGARARAELGAAARSRLTVLGRSPPRPGSRRSP
ncbi:MAG: YwiC-like family protein [Polyangiaceae bacterium]|nr:YwiC-like family protein [Polyangiaceae bacterium]